MRFKSTLIASTLALGTALGSASVLAAGHDDPGTPGEPNCHGQTHAWLNEAWRELDPPVHGVGGAVKAGFWNSAAELQDAIREHCEPEDDDDDDDDDDDSDGDGS